MKKETEIFERIAVIAKQINETKAKLNSPDCGPEYRDFLQAQLLNLTGQGNLLLWVVNDEQ